MTESRPRQALCMRRLACLLLVGLLGWLPVARADNISCTPTGKQFSLPNFGDVIVPSRLEAGKPIGLPTYVDISFTCTGINGNQTVAILASVFGPIVSYSGNAVLFQTSVAGIALKLTAEPMPKIGNTNRIVFATLSSSGTVTVRVTGQLIKTQGGPIGASSLTMPTALIGTFEYEKRNDNGNGNGRHDLNSQLVLLAGTNLIASCTIDTDAILVTLPVVTTGAFSGVGSTSRSTPFQIDLTCSSGSTVAITLDTATPVAGTTDVIAPSGGGAGGVGVQLLDSSGGSTVEFGVAKTIGATPDGPLPVQYFARYYQTGSAVSAGSLSATATFTISYQ